MRSAADRSRKTEKRRTLLEHRSSSPGRHDDDQSAEPRPASFGRAQFPQASLRAEDCLSTDKSSPEVAAERHREISKRR